MRIFRFCYNPHCGMKFHPSGKYSKYCPRCSHISLNYKIKAKDITKKMIDSYKKLNPLQEEDKKNNSKFK